MADTLTFSNFAKSTLTQDITETATTVTLSDVSLFSDGTFTAAIWDSGKPSPLEDESREIILITKSGNTLTAQRGRENTTAKAWGAGSSVANVITADTMNSLMSSGGDSILTVTDATYEMTPFVRTLNFVCSETVPTISVSLPSASACEASEFLLINSSTDIQHMVVLTPYGTDTFKNLTGMSMSLYAGSSVRLVSDGTAWHLSGFLSGAQSAKLSITPQMDLGGGMIVMPYAEVFAGAGIGMLHVDATETLVYVYVQTSDCMQGVPLTIIRTDNGMNTVFVPLSNGVHMLNRQGDSVTVATDGEGGIFAISSYSAGGVVTLTEESFLTYGEKVVRCDATSGNFGVSSNFAHLSAGQSITFIKTDDTANEVTITLVTEWDSPQITLSSAEPQALVVSDGIKWHRLV